MYAYQVLWITDEHMYRAHHTSPFHIPHSEHSSIFFESPLESATMVSDDYFDDDGFIHYIPTTVDADYLLLVVTTLFCILSNAILPCLVSLGSRYEKRKLARGSSELKDESADATSEQPQPVKDRAHGALEIIDNSRKSEGDQNTDSHGGGTSSRGGVGTDVAGNTTWRSLLDQVRLNNKWISSYEQFCRILLSVVIPANHPNPAFAFRSIDHDAALSR